MSEDLRAVDQAMLLAISPGQRAQTPLSVDQERLIDKWIAGHLPPIDADRAAELVKGNRLAAERVLERRLMVAASVGPAVPSALADRILKASQSKTLPSGMISFRWPTFSVRRLSQFAATAAVVVMTVNSLAENKSSSFSSVGTFLSGSSPGGSFGVADQSGAGGLAFVFLCVAALACFVASDFVRVLSSGYANTWRGTVSRKRQPIRYWCYVLIDCSMLVCCAMLLLLAGFIR
jgi:hypothetical protein